MSRSASSSKNPVQSCTLTKQIEVMTTGPDILLFSSAAREVYKQDTFDATSDPPGYGLRFRYETKLVSDNVETNDLEGKKAIIIAVVGNESETADLSYTPLREAEILDANPTTNALYLDLELTPRFVDYLSDSATSAEEYEKFIDKLEDNPENEKYVVQSDFEFDLTGNAKYEDGFSAWEDQEATWTRLVKMLCDRHEEYEDGFYYRLIDIERTTDLSYIERAISLVPNSIGEVEDVSLSQIGGPTTRGPILLNNHEYEFKISFYYPTAEKDNFKFGLSTSSDSEFYPSEIPSGFKTDQRNFHTQSSKSFDRNVVSIEGRPKVENPPEGPKLNLPTRFIPPRGFKYFFLGIFAVGLGLSSGLPDLFIGQFQILPISEANLETFVQLIGVLIVTFIFNLYSSYL